jgi:hypothetical protein
MNNAQLLRRLPKLAEKEKRLKALAGLLEKLKVRRDALEEEVMELRTVTEIFKGVALVRSGDDICAADASKYRRSARVYQNANDATLWGLSLLEWPISPGRRRLEHWKGASWPSERRAMTAAKNWIVYGTEPKRNGDGRPESWR